MRPRGRSPGRARIREDVIISLTGSRGENTGWYSLCAERMRRGKGREGYDGILQYICHTHLTLNVCR